MSLNRNFEVTDLRNYIEYHQLLPEPIILYVLGGDAVVDINLRATELHADSMIYTTGASVMHLEQASADFRAAIITVSSNQFAEIATRHCHVANDSTHVCISAIGDDSRVLMRHLIAAIELSAHLAENATECASHCICAIFDVIEHLMAAGSVDAPSANRYLQQFAALLFRHVATEHEVRFYAGQLNITPKYLNELTQRVLGKSAKDAISIVLTSLIRHDLLTGDSNIKALASKYNFCDQSSLGKFFKKETGMSPNTFLMAKLYNKQDYYNNNEI